MGDHMASEIIWIKGKHLSRACLRYDTILTYVLALIFEVFWYHLKRMYSIVFKKLNCKMIFQDGCWKWKKMKY